MCHFRDEKQVHKFANSSDQLRGAPCRSIVVRAYRKKDTGGSQDTTGRGREKEELTGTVQYVSLINTNLPRNKPEPGYPLPPHDLG